MWLWRVQMVERQAGVAKRLELGADLGLDLLAHLGQIREAKACLEQIVFERAITVEQRRNMAPWQHRASARQYEVQADRE